jgi:gp16 family phage-associated protein
MTQTAKTIDEVRAELARAGINVSEWARTHGFARMTVVDVLRGHRQGLRGEAHRVAVALGLKVGEVVDVASFKSLPGTATTAMPIKPRQATKTPMKKAA